MGIIINYNSQIQLNYNPINTVFPWIKNKNKDYMKGDLKLNKIMILKGGSPAIHKMGNIGRKIDDKIRIHSEDETNYIGNFEEGFGFIDVKFNKNDCRPLTTKERENLNGIWYGNPMYRIYVDEEGNVIKGKTVIVKGIINKVTDTLDKDKHNEFIGLKVEFGEDIQLGRSMVMITNKGTLTISRVTNVDIINNQYIIYTNNSVYYIEVNNR